MMQLNTIAHGVPAAFDYRDDVVVLEALLRAALNTAPLITSPDLPLNFYRNPFSARILWLGECRRIVSDQRSLHRVVSR